jgi:pyruvate dehydrogenase E2 component (dihydrolipoamide acetyltransferase)
MKQNFLKKEVMKVAVNIKMPKWNLAMKEGRITRWFKNEGDMVNIGDDLFEVETMHNRDKVKAPATGKLSQIFIPAGGRVPVKVVVAVLSEPGEPQYINL